MNKLSFSPSSKMTIPLYVHQHDSEKKIRFPWVFSSIFKNKKYAKIDSMFIKYVALMKSDDYGEVNIMVIDKRKQFTEFTNVIEVSLRSDVDTEIAISNLEWADRKAPCPYVLKINLDIKGLRPGVKIGELMVEPAFKYTNKLPEAQKIQLTVLPSIPQESKGRYVVEITKDEFAKKKMKGAVKKLKMIDAKGMLNSVHHVQ